MTNILNIEIERALSNLSGVEVVLFEARPSSWVVIPSKRGQLRSKVWQTLRSGPLSGIGSTPMVAALLMARAVGVGGARKVAPKYRAREWLIDQFSDGQPIQVNKIRSMAVRSGMTWSSVDRAARDLSIKRTKCGFRSGWTWQMPCLNEVK